METSPPIPPDDAAPADSRPPGHETSDARLGPIVWFVIVLGVVATLIHGMVWKFMRSAERQNAREDMQPSPFVLDRAPPPEPRLQPSVQHPTEPQEDMEQLRKRWTALLTTYGKVEGAPDRVRIPIDRAMAIAVERGLPGRRPAAQPVTQPATRSSTLPVANPERSPG